MAYEKPKLIDLNGETETGHGQQMGCATGSGALGVCSNGPAAGVYCSAGSGGTVRPVPP